MGTLYYGLELWGSSLEKKTVVDELRRYQGRWLRTIYDIPAKANLNNVVVITATPPVDISLKQTLTYRQILNGMGSSLFGIDINCYRKNSFEVQIPP